jgi:molecular chaperone DnaJ/curved DNA-binding protein
MFDGAGGRGAGGGGGLGDILGQFFGGGGVQAGGGGARQRRQRRGRRGRQQTRQGARDTETTLRLSFQQALEGGPTQVRLPGGEQGSQTMRIKIPKGARPGMKIRLRGQGKKDAAGRKGDLYVTFRVADHPRFERRGDDLHLTEEVGVFEATLGTERRIENAYGEQIRLRIPPGTQPGAQLRMKGQGVETEKTTGDLYVEIDVRVPEDLTDEQRETLEAAAEEAGLV